MMLEALISGLMLGFAYAAPIGAQNIFVIDRVARVGLPRGYIVAMCTAFHDIALAACCFWGMGIVIEKVPFLKLGLLSLGAVFLLKIGYGIITSAKDIAVDDSTQAVPAFSVLTIFASAAALTWLNPQALIDGSILLGSFQAGLDTSLRGVFFAGVAIASASWFLSLAMLVSYLKRNKKNHILKYISLVCGALLMFFAVKMACDAYTAFNDVKSSINLG